MDKERIGKHIASLRKEKNLTQKQLAEKLNVTDKAVSKWERGLCYPDLTMLEPLAQEFEISVTELLLLEETAAEEVIKEVTAISIEEKEAIRKNIRQRGILTIILGCILMVSQITASWLFNSLGYPGGIYGMTTTGMLGFTSTLIAGAIYTIKQVRKM